MLGYFKKCTRGKFDNIYFHLILLLVVLSISPFRMISIHESGLLHVWKRRWWPKANTCKSGLVMEAKAISIIDVQSAFYVAAGGALLGLFAFVIEIIVAKVIQCRSRSK